MRAVRRQRSLWAAAWAAALVVTVGGCSTGILHGLDERSANEAEASLERAGIAAEKVADDTAALGGTTPVFTVRVARADGARALDLLRAAGLPRDRRRGFAEAYGQPSLIPTASEERARYLDALAGEIERTLETVDGVVGARVHLVPVDIDPGALDGDDAKPRPAARAAVLLKTRPESARAGRPPIDPADVRRLVAGSVPGLAEAAVAVVTTAAPEPSASVPALAAVGPLRVSVTTRPLLVGTLAVGLALVALLAVLLLLTARRLATLERAGGLPAQGSAQRKT
jgi:type III secretion protein J